ncbi:MAG: hypothetical protein ACK4L7_06790, partial [Flavobacteriales bacterium]
MEPRTAHRALARLAKRWGGWAVGLSALGAAVAFPCDLLVRRGSPPCLHDDMASLPFNTAGLVLGTSPRARGGADPFFQGRIAAASDL